MSAPPAAPAATPGTGRPPLRVIFLITVTGITVNTLITASIPEILAGLGVGTGLAGVLVSAATLPGVLLAPVIGVLADRYGRREVIVPCLVLFAVSGGLGALAPNLWVLAGLRFLQGTGSAGLINLAVVIIGDHWDGTERAAMIGRNSAVLTVCLAVFPTVGGVLTDLGSWRTPFLVYPLALVSAVVVARGLPAGERSGVSVRQQVADLLPILRRPPVMAMLGATAVVFALIFGAILTVLPVYTAERFGLGSAWRGVILGLPAVGSTVAALLLGRTTRRLGRPRLLVGAAALGVAGLLAIVSAPSVGLLAVATVIFGLFEGSTIPTLQDLAAEVGGRHSRGGTVATQVSAARLGQTLGPLGLGAAFDGLGVGAAYVLAAVVGAVVLIPLVRVAARAGGPSAPTGQPALPWE